MSVEASEDDRVAATELDTTPARMEEPANSVFPAYFVSYAFENVD